MTADTATTPDTAALQAVADQLASVISSGDTAQAKALLRILIADLRVNSRAEILPTYRVTTPTVCAHNSSVEPTGIEPVTSCLQSRGGVAGAYGYGVLRLAKWRYGRRNRPVWYSKRYSGAMWYSCGTLY
jgi:hypothetical protein